MLSILYIYQLTLTLQHPNFIKEAIGDLPKVTPLKVTKPQRSLCF